MFTHTVNPEEKVPGLIMPIAALALMGSFISGLAISLSFVNGFESFNGAWVLVGFMRLLALSFAATDLFKSASNDASKSARKITQGIIALGSLGLIASLIYFGSHALMGVFLAYGVGSALLILGGRFLPAAISGAEKFFRTLFARGSVAAPQTAPLVSQEPWLMIAANRKKVIWGSVIVGSAITLGVAARVTLSGVFVAIFALPVLAPIFGFLLHGYAQRKAGSGR